MRKDRKYMLGGGIAIILGWLSTGFGYSTTMVHPTINGICFLGGLLLFFLGVIFFIIGANTKSYKK